MLSRPVLVANHKIIYNPAPKGAGIPGAVAQLGERLPCKQEVVGSTPISSTRMCNVGYVSVCAVQLITFTAISAKNLSAADEVFRTHGLISRRSSVGRAFD